MKLELLHKLALLIEEILHVGAPAVEQAAEAAAVASVEQDPKVQAVTAATAGLLAAAQGLKAAINTPPAPPAA